MPAAGYNSMRAIASASKKKARFFWSGNERPSGGHGKDHKFYQLAVG